MLLLVFTVYHEMLLLQDIHVGTDHGILLSDPVMHNVDFGCNVTDQCETVGAALCPRDRGTCVSSWNASSCLCHPGTSLIFHFSTVVK